LTFELFSFRGYQYYNFSVLKELSEPCQQLAQEKADDTFKQEMEQLLRTRMVRIRIGLIFFWSEYRDEDEKGKNAVNLPKVR